MPSSDGLSDGDDDDEEEEECVFSLEGCHDASAPTEHDGEDGGGLGLQYEMVGLDGDDGYVCDGAVDLGLEDLDLDQRVQASFQSASSRGGPDGEGGLSLGASPVLLSAIEQVAAKAEAARPCG